MNSNASVPFSRPAAVKIPLFRRVGSKVVIVVGVFLATLFASFAGAHEPLYGFGPHVLFKGGFAPHFTFHAGDEMETEYALGYGLTRKWTIKGEVPFHIEEGGYHFGGFAFKQKYLLFSRFNPGLSHQISAVSTVNFPAEPEKPTVVNIGAAGGRESLRWYWFLGAVYGIKFDGGDVRPGNHLIYNATLGYRPVKTSYYRPDIVFFVEGVGRFQQRSVNAGSPVARTGGQSWSAAPTFMLTYRNIALRGGVEFGLAQAQYLEKPETNYKLIVEAHL